CFVFFFFQAEDGIRDFHVTGVQTCALPIFVIESIESSLEGVAIALTIPPARAGTLDARRRSLEGRSGCGICGMAQVEAVLRPPQIGRASCRERVERAAGGGAREKRSTEEGR